MSRTSFRVNPDSLVCLNVKELLARSRRYIWSLSDSNEIRTHNHLVHKRTLNHLAKLASLVNGWVFVCELSGCGFECSSSHLNFRFCACFVQGVSWHSGNYRAWIHSETRTWHNKNIQSVEIVDLSNKLLPLLLAIVENRFLVLCLVVGST